MKGCVKHILLVEDDVGSALLLKRMLLAIDESLEVRTVPSAEAAYLAFNEVEWDQKIPFDLVVADVNLPGSNGFLFWDLATRRFPTEFLFVSSMPKRDWFQQIKKWLERKEERDIPRFLQKPVTEDKLKAFWYGRRAR